MKTERSSIVDELAEKYKDGLAHARKELRRASPKPRRGYESDVMLFQKWAYRVGKGWYGFSLGNIPDVWRLVLDDFFEWLEKARPDFVIHQVKIKFRSMRIYLGTKTDLFIPDEKIKAEISKLQKLLSLPPCDETITRPARKKHNTRPLQKGGSDASSPGRSGKNAGKMKRPRRRGGAATSAKVSK
ncbi:MAG TPA: hypothetical protein VFY06_07870 [Verrucomicrobiae bacterium]|nr:hypothetical protein [Verrucomicrobiae bacterium]